MSYTSLSMLNKSRQSSAAPKDEAFAVPARPKIPFSAAHRTEEPSQEGITPMNDGSTKWRVGRANQSLDARSVADKVAAQKAELAEKIKVLSCGMQRDRR